MFLIGHLVSSYIAQTQPIFSEGVFLLISSTNTHNFSSEIDIKGFKFLAHLNIAVLAMSYYVFYLFFFMYHFERILSPFCFLSLLTCTDM